MYPMVGSRNQTSNTLIADRTLLADEETVELVARWLNDGFHPLNGALRVPSSSTRPIWPGWRASWPAYGFCRTAEWTLRTQ